MLRTKMVLLAEAVIRDSQANTVSIINLIEGIGMESFPVLIPKVSVLGLFSRDDGDPSRVKVRFEAVLATTRLFSGEGLLDFEDKPNTRFILNVQGFVLTGPGQLRFSFYQDSKKLGSYEVTVLLKGGPQINEVTEAQPGKTKPRPAKKPKKPRKKPAK